MAIDLKYGKVTVERGSIGDDEPVFVIRAQDRLAEDILERYRSSAMDHLCKRRFVSSLDRAIRAFRKWKGQRKLPD